MPKNYSPRNAKPDDAPAAIASDEVLTKLRELPSTTLDRLVRRWLKRSGLHLLPDPDVTTHPPTYAAAVSAGRLTTGVQVRVHRRKNRLQTHHVDAFLGHLLRTGSTVGILVTTGDITAEAAHAAHSTSYPKIRLVSGREWLQELASHGIALRRLSYRLWLLDTRSAPTKARARW